MSEPTHPWCWAITPHLWYQQYPKRFTDADIRGFLAFLEEKVPTLPTPYAWIVDTGGLLRANRAQRAMLAAYGEKTEAHDREHSAGAAIVAHGLLARGAVKSAYFVNPPVYPYAVFGAVPEAEAWARAQLRKRGVDA